ncbi:hypothetical protein SprV_0300999200 [Sparganum proliferum]
MVDFSFSWKSQVDNPMSCVSPDIERPTDVRAEAISSESIQVTWRAPGYKLSNESGYRLLIIGQDFNATAVVGSDTFTHTFFGLKPSTEYAVYVQVNDSVRGAPRPTGNSSATTWTAGRQACGRQTFAPAAWPTLQSTRREANRHSWPWTVGLYTSIRGGYPYCGGTLVAPQWIVTAAHCVEMAMDCTTAPVGNLFSYKAFTNATLFARIGDHDLGKTEASERDRRVQSVIIHPHYKVHSGNREHDVALLRLEKTVAAGKEVDFICLPGGDSSVTSSKECAFAGWGSVTRSRTLGYQNSPVLTEGRLKIESGDFCKLSTEGSGHEGQACLSTGTGAPCFGDSGAGVYCTDAEGKWILYGIINRGSFLCDEHGGIGGGVGGSGGGGGGGGDGGGGGGGGGDCGGGGGVTYGCPGRMFADVNLTMSAGRTFKSSVTLLKKKNFLAAGLAKITCVLKQSPCQLEEVAGCRTTILIPQYTKSMRQVSS